ncbi:MAG: glucokinase [Acidimicrobiaceae bacterium]|jgi:glucokinase|nr:glucokinase [Acidimicrobiaceae bacterium]MDQ1414609.1 glucokinase [Acidimicrobiaceae bacterium]
MPEVIGVDVGGTKILALQLRADGSLGQETRKLTPRGGEAVLDAIAEAVDSLGPVKAVGVGAPGLVDHAGILQFAPNLPHVVGLPVRAGLEQRLPGVVVTVGNDATCAGWAERLLGAGQGSHDLLMVTLGTGIGGGLVGGGELLLGANGFSGEIGHMVVDIHGPPCPCGKRGCWERFASGSGLGRLGREAAEAGQAPRVAQLAGGDPVAVRGEHVTAAALEGDAGAMDVIHRFAWWVALGLANLANVFDPECIVLGGGLAESGGVFLEPVRTAFNDLVEAAEYRPPIRIVLAQLGERAGAVGAALLARHASGAPAATPRP